MLAPTHRAFATASAGATLLTVHYTTEIFAEVETSTLILQSIIIVVLSYLTATLPDMDQFVPFLGHRGITHAIWIPGIIFYFLWGSTGEPYLFAVLAGVFIGYTSHLIGDAFSTAGIAWLYPIQQYGGSSNGAFWVKGFRGPFLPLYQVGTPFIIKPAIIWYTLAGIALLFYVKAAFL